MERVGDSEHREHIGDIPGAPTSESDAAEGYKQCHEEVGARCDDSSDHRAPQIPAKCVHGNRQGGKLNRVTAPGVWITPPLNCGRSA
jgi:hypothetical protein